ncbi:hypothetical protein ELH43_39905 [Rhizobium ruizarguesonis]|nr:hypothetical protein [Rhizobium leguminosarum]QIO63137.1 hypothetical protein HA463_36150 [Rhizobium leguminosarum bv. trifolii]TAW18100.1 hypothetical protein ELI25_20870 [Rhizobium ruizarguesonis]RWX24735.1 hypothetical protein EHH54_36735 [Rhizobium leguminosarum]TAY75850.1 hypothetical protein ELH84_19235 [Rhizobium ruizarguesonis]
MGMRLVRGLAAVDAARIVAARADHPFDRLRSRIGRLLGAPGKRTPLEFGSLFSQEPKIPFPDLLHFNFAGNPLFDP